MALGKKTGGRKEGTPNKQRRPKRATEEREAAKNALVNTARGLLDHPQIITVMRRLGKERMTEVEEMALEEALNYREAARKGDVAAETLFWKYLGLVLEAAARRAPYESPRLAAIAVRDEKADDRVITGESARERLLQTVLAVIAAEDAEAAARAERAVDVTPALDGNERQGESVPDSGDGDGEAA
jgi:hypothetical protein